MFLTLQSKPDIHNSLKKKEKKKIKIKITLFKAFPEVMSVLDYENIPFPLFFQRTFCLLDCRYIMPVFLKNKIINIDTKIMTNFRYKTKK